jgi:hypothetical protein
MPPDVPSYSGANLPENYPADFVQYARVDRTDGTIRDLYIARDALETTLSNGSLRDDAIIVIDGYDARRDANGDLLLDENGHYVKDVPFESFHIAVKRPDWDELDFPTTVRAGNWNFFSFDQQTHEPFDEDLGACFNCHQATPQSDFIYTRRQLARFASSGEVQYFLCNLSERIACPQEG